ncbi:asparaginase domain-containing protein [Neptunomonas sp. XY-337]|uniref:asparaginase domain-containing protein n=1 Tax=Neptunomonas sp. XY-337 TaxID=2561897 RepID=UPI0010A9FF31|nr:asparaginase domain-containing protein [Neptunomonas sp. XY-337]
MTNSTKFHLIATGGTIDSYYDPDQCTVLCYDKSILPRYLNQHVGLTQEAYMFSQLCMKDSREINDRDRAGMVAAISNSPMQSVVLTHGSFTVFETARFLVEHQAELLGKTVVLTGALRPIDGFTHSDGLFNLGASALAAQLAAPGVYVCIDGKVYLPYEKDVWH